jgi:hypothetical protein
VFGVGGALTLKFRHYFWESRDGNAPGSGAGGEVTAADLSKQLGGIQQALVGSDDSTLVSQLKLSRQDSNDRLDALKRAQIEALEKLKEMGTATLIDALKEVIRDFNTKISEQFGENFKQLNDAVGKLLVWQQQYKEQMEVLARDVKDISSSMHTATDSYKDLVGRSETFTTVARDLGGLLSGLQTQKDHLNTSLKALADLLLKASGSLPEIETKIVSLTDHLTSAVTRNQTEIDRTLTKNADAQRVLVETLSGALMKLGADATAQIAGFGDRLGTAIQAAQALAQEAVTSTQRHVSQTLTASQDQVNKSIAAAQERAISSFTASHDQTSKAWTVHGENIKTAITANSEAIRTSIQSSNEGFVKMNQEFNKQIAELAAKTKEQVSTLDLALEVELKKSLETLGQQLAALSQKFVEDYGPLTDRLRVLVNTLGKAA